MKEDDINIFIYV